jgi:hypothetical protein
MDDGKVHAGPAWAFFCAVRKEKPGPGDANKINTRKGIV